MITVILGVALVTSIIANAWLVNSCIIRAREERRDLMDRVMALSETGVNALVTKNSIQTIEQNNGNEGSSVVYVDENRQLELQGAHREEE